MITPTPSQVEKAWKVLHEVYPASKLGDQQDWIGDMLPIAQALASESARASKETEDVAKALQSCFGELDRLKVTYAHGLESRVEPPNLEIIKHSMEILSKLNTGDGG